MTKSELEQEVLGLRLELQDYSSLFDLQQKRMTKAVGLWRDATGHNYLPDLECLLDWLMKRVAELHAMTQERDALRREVRWLANQASIHCYQNECCATMGEPNMVRQEQCIECTIRRAKADVKAAQAGKVGRRDD